MHYNPHVNKMHDFLSYFNLQKANLSASCISQWPEYFWLSMEI